MSELIESLKKCRLDGNILHLPPVSDGMLANYGEVRSALLKAGAKYKRGTFVFPNDAQPYIDRLCGGETVNIKKEFQFFATPSALCDELVRDACIEKGHSVLEPSAGQGAIVQAIQRAVHISVDYFELSPINLNVMDEIANANLRGHDFLSDENTGVQYDRIIANPPFSKNQDIDHIRKMYECLKPGGRIVTIASPHYQMASGKKEKAFKQWLDELSASVDEIPANTFKESGTSIRTVKIIIDRP